MPDLKEVHQRIRHNKQEKKRLNDMVKEARQQSQTYQKVEEELKALKAKKLQLENGIKSEFRQELDKMDQLSQTIKTDVLLLTDLALTKFMKGETVELTDENDTKYEPEFKVTFKRVG